MPAALDETPESTEPLFDEYIRLQNAIAKSRPKDLPGLYLKRGMWRIRMSAAKGGLVDLLRAYALTLSPTPDTIEVIRAGDIDVLLKSVGLDGLNAFDQPTDKVSPTLYAHLGEAFRLYIRDVLLSLPSDSNREQLARYASFSIGAFNAAVLLLDNDTNAVGERKAWVLAHRGATYTMLYWLARVTTGGEDDATRLFERAEKSFTLALEEKRDYVWAQLFKAFALALRGEARTTEDPSDFRRARNLLRTIEPKSAGGGLVNQAFINRHKAMLYSYDVGEDRGREDPRDSLEAAKRSLESSWIAQREDDLEFLGPYFASLSAYHLFTSAGDRDGYACDRESLETVIESATMRTRNALSQALVALAGLHTLTETIFNGDTTEVGKAKVASSKNEREKLEDVFTWFPPDLETLAIFLRKPLASIIDGSDYEQKLLKPFSLEKTVLTPEIMNSLLHFSATTPGDVK